MKKTNKKEKKELTMREKKRYEAKIMSAFISVIGLILCLLWIFLSKYFGY
jgi:flagellar biogenesis protein FliO